MNKATAWTRERRSFLTHLGIGVGVVGAALAGSPAAPAQSAAVAPWRSARHAQDDWLEQIPGQHRVAFDTNTADGIGLALLFANNYFFANRQGYQLQDSDLAVVIVA